MMASPPSCWLLSLPDEMVLNCFARVSRLDLMSLSMVSKRCRSLVFSPELYKTRSQIGCTEECVYVFFHSPRESKPLWFILKRVKGKSFENQLIPIPSFQTPLFSSIVTFDGGIYVIGGLIESRKTSLVSFLNCRTHTWSYLPSMRFARSKAKVGVLDGRIYVIGGCKNNNNLSNWAEVFDPKMQTWSVVNIRDPKVSMWNDKRLLYYCDPHGEIMWCEPWNGVMYWEKVYGLEESFRLPIVSVLPGGEMADVWRCYLLNHGLSLPEYKLSISDGNIIIFWNKFVKEEPKRMEIWCTEISTERREGGEVWGTVQWSEHVYTVDHLPYFVKLLHSVSVAI